MPAVPRSEPSRDGGRRRARAAAVLVVAAVVANAVATTLVELRVARRDAGFDFPVNVTDTGYGLALTGVLMGGGAAVVLWRAAPTRGRGFGWALAATGLFWGLDGLAQSYVRLGLVQDRALPAMTFAVWFLFRLTAFLPLSVVLLPLLFPTGRFPRGPWRVASWTTVSVLTLMALSFIVAPSDVYPENARLPVGVDPDPTTIGALEPLTAALVPTLRLAGIVILLVPLAVVVHRYRRAEGLERDRMRWLLWAVITVAIVTVIALVVDVAALDGLATFLGVNLVPLAMVVAITDPALVSIDDLLGRTLVYGGLTVSLVLVDLALVAVLATLLDDALAQRQVVVLVLLVSVLLYGPLRVRLAAAVRRRVLGDRENPYDIVAGLASTLEATDDATSQLAAVARAVTRAFGVGFVRVEVERGEGERIVATHGDEPDRTRTMPITYRDVEVGRLVLPARGLRSRLGRRDEQLLGDLVRQAVTAVRAGRLADQLQESRERLVTAREEERRRIRRDLHDGLGPALSGVVFQLESARLQVDTDAETAKAAITRTSGHLQDVVADVRRLVHDLRPPALDDRGLVGALRQQAESLSRDDGVTVSVEAAGVDDLPAAVEVAAFRIAGEAMTNAVRHADARHARVRVHVEEPGAEPADLVPELTVRERTVLVEVVDDGAGIPPDAEAGVGLISLRERAAELGGRTTITCPEQGGTAVRAWLPLRSTP